ncbi:MAG: HNH endonuclease [Phycisphaerales bacterium]
MSRYGRRWTREETLLAFDLYCRLPFGRLHRSTPAIVELANDIGRTPSSIAMKACNFASLDRQHSDRGVVGLRNRGKLEEEIWQAFNRNSVAIVSEIFTVKDNLTGGPKEPGEFPTPDGPSEVERSIKVRRLQGFFRDAVLTNYSHRCGLSGLALPDLLNASHIVPWSVSQERRCDPRNGISLNALYDRAFDRGLFTLSESLEVVLSARLIRPTGRCGSLSEVLEELEGRRLDVPERFAPDPEALRYHRKHIFKADAA